MKTAKIQKQNKPKALANECFFCGKHITANHVTDFKHKDYDVYACGKCRNIRVKE